MGCWVYRSIRLSLVPGENVPVWAETFIRMQCHQLALKLSFKHTLNQETSLFVSQHDSEGFSQSNIPSRSDR